MIFHYSCRELFRKGLTDAAGNFKETVTHKGAHFQLLCLATDQLQGSQTVKDNFQFGVSGASNLDYEDDQLLDVQTGRPLKAASEVGTVVRCEMYTCDHKRVVPGYLVNCYYDVYQFNLTLRRQNDFCQYSWTMDVPPVFYTEYSHMPAFRFQQSVTNQYL